MQSCKKQVVNTGEDDIVGLQSYIVVRKEMSMA